MKDTVQPGPSGKFLQRANHLKGDPDIGGAAAKDSSSAGGALGIGNVDDWDVTGHFGADLLSEAVRLLIIFLHFSVLEKGSWSA